MTTYQEIEKGTQEVVSRLLEDVGTDPNRWIDVVEALDDLPENEFDRVLAQLETFDLSAFSTEQREKVAEKLRALVSRHTEFTDADWALPIEQVRRVRSVLVTYEPEDILSRNAWLFKENPDFPEEGASGWEARDEAIRVARVNAVKHLIEEGGLPLLLELVPKVERPWHVGFSIGQITEEIDDEKFLSSQLSHHDAAYDEMVKGYVHSRVQTRGEAWVRGLLASETSKKWRSEQRGELLVALPFEPSSWELVAAETADVQRYFWMNVSIYGRGKLEPEIVEATLRKFLEYGRLGTAIDFAAMYRGKVDPQTVAEVLASAKAESSNEEINWSRLAYDVGELLNVVRTSEAISEDDLVGLEWFYLPLLGRGGHLPEVLYKKLAEDAAFFVQVLSFVYRAADETEPEEPTEAQKGRAHVAWRLLHEWTLPPGLKEDQAVDSGAVKHWVQQARDIAAEENRVDIADVNIGEILSMLPEGEDGAWPHESVRDLLEELQNSQLEDGLVVGRLNSRGITSRSIGEGGVQERDLVARYTNYLETLRERWPRAAKVVKEIIEHYELDARREDVRAEFDRERWG